MLPDAGERSMSASVALHERRATLVVELLTEELPPKALQRLGDAFAEGIARRACKARGYLSPAESRPRRSRRRGGWRWRSRTCVA